MSQEQQAPDNTHPDTEYPDPDQDRDDGHADPNPDGDLPAVTESELDTLKARADLMGIRYHPSIGLDKLREKVNKAITSPPGTDHNAEDRADHAPNPAFSHGVSATAPEESPAQIAKRQKDDALKLIRIRVSCMNPAKKDWEGEIFTVANSVVGTVKKFVPFNTDDGWHVPNFIYKMIRDRECQIFYDAKDSRGNKVRKGKMIREFAVEILPPLTPAELKDLAQRQAMSQAID